MINSFILLFFLTPPRSKWLRERGCVGTIARKHRERNKHVRACNICDEVRRRSRRGSGNILLEGVPGDYVLEY